MQVDGKTSELMVQQLREWVLWHIVSNVFLGNLNKPINCS